MPKVTIIIPCYNQAHYLCDSISSLTSQTLTNWECIIVNDGSTDNTEEVATHFAQQDPRIHYIHKENGGLSSARNTGLKAATGKYIQLLDADDTIHPDKLMLQVSAFESSPNSGIVFSDFEYVDNDDINKRHSSPKNFRTKYLQNNTITSLLSGNFIVVHAALVKKDVIEAVGLFDETLNACEDYDYWLRACMGGHKFTYIDKILAFYRQNRIGMSSNKFKQTYATIRVVSRYHKKFKGSNRRICLDYITSLYCVLLGTRKNYPIPTALLSRIVAEKYYYHTLRFFS